MSSRLSPCSCSTTTTRRPSDWWLPDPAGPIPVGVTWWGALGGVTISLTGIFRHPRSWDDAHNGWHVARPVLGAVGRSRHAAIPRVSRRLTQTWSSASKMRSRPCHGARAVSGPDVEPPSPEQLLVNPVRIDLHSLVEFGDAIGKLFPRSLLVKGIQDSS